MKKKTKHNIFDDAIADIFKCDDFIEYCTIDDETFECICSMISDQATYVYTGTENPALFTLDIKLPVRQIPKIGAKVIFREKTYKVAYVDVDSANTSFKLHLADLSRGV